MDIDTASTTSSQTSENDVPQRAVIQNPEAEAPQVRAPKLGPINKDPFHDTFDSFGNPGPKWSSTVRKITDKSTIHAIHPKKIFVAKPAKSVQKGKPKPVKYGNNLQQYIKKLLSERSTMRDRHRGNREGEKLDRTEAILQAETMRYKISTNIRKLREKLNDNSRNIE